MTTIYTVNNKVLKNSANDKWLIKKEGPAGFVMNASNAIYTPVDMFGYNVIYIAWESPTYPNAYNGSGKQYILINNNSAAPEGGAFGYSPGTNSITATAISSNDMKTLGTSTGELGSGSGAYLVWTGPLGISGTLEQVQAYMANVSITIVDP